MYRLNTYHAAVLYVRKVSPGLMPPGSPGIFRQRKSSTYEAVHNFSLLSTNANLIQKMSDSPNETPQETLPSNISNPWSNSKDDYELKEIIGKKFNCLLIFL